MTEARVLPYAVRSASCFPEWTTYDDAATDRRELAAGCRGARAREIILGGVGVKCKQGKTGKNNTCV